MANEWRARGELARHQLGQSGLPSHMAFEIGERLPEPRHLTKPERVGERRARAARFMRSRNRRCDLVDIARHVGCTLAGGGRVTSWYIAGVIERETGAKPPRLPNASAAKKRSFLEKRAFSAEFNKRTEFNNGDL